MGQVFFPVDHRIAVRLTAIKFGGRVIRRSATLHSKESEAPAISISWTPTVLYPHRLSDLEQPN